MMIKNIKYSPLNDHQEQVERISDDYRYRSDMLNNLKAMLCIVGVLLSLFTSNASHNELTLICTEVRECNLNGYTRAPSIKLLVRGFDLLCVYRTGVSTRSCDLHLFILFHVCQKKTVKHSYT